MYIYMFITKPKVLSRVTRFAGKNSGRATEIL